MDQFASERSTDLNERVSSDGGPSSGLCLSRSFTDHGTNPNALDSPGNTTSHKASYYGQIMVVKLLLRYDANADAQCKWGRTVLHTAASEGHLEIVQLLSEHGADANTR